MGTPYYDALKKAAESSKLRLNVPGHQNDYSLFQKYFPQDMLSLDLPQLLNGIDKGPNNALQQSLEETAEVFKANKAWFLTGGASQANRIIGLVLGQLGYHDEVIIAQRNAHSSFFDSVIVSGLNTIFINPSVDTLLGISHGITAADIESALLNSERRAKAIYVVSPSYYGSVEDIKSISQVAKKYDVPLIVDAAWGSHFGFHKSFPENPIKLGADIVVSSTHKMAGSLTQSAMLLTGKTKWGEELEAYIERGYLLTASTSTSALLLASLDVAKHLLKTNAYDYDSLINNITKTRELLKNNFPSLEFVDERTLSGKHPDVKSQDPLKLGLNINSYKADGFTLLEELFEKYGIFAEMATANSLLLVIGLQKTDMSILPEALKKYLKTLKTKEELKYEDKKFITADTTALNMREAYFSGFEIVPIKESINRVSADMVAAYPPGIPNVLPGEIFDEQVINFISQVGQMPGGYVRGAAKQDGSMVRVLK